MTDQQTELDQQDTAETQENEGGDAQALESVDTSIFIGSDEDSSTSDPKEAPLSNGDAAKRRISAREKKRATSVENKEIDILREENRKAAEELRQLRSANQATNQSVTPPTLEQHGFDVDEHNVALQQWAKNLPNNQNAASGETPNVAQAVRDEFARQNNVLTEAQQIQEEEREITEHYSRASKLKVKGYIEAEKTALEILGDDYVVAIQRMLPNSEMVLFHLGKNPKKAQLLKNLNDTNPGKATLELGSIAGSLRKSPKTKLTPEPDEGLEGSSNNSKKEQFADTTEGRQQARRAKLFDGTSWG